MWGPYRIRTLPENTRKLFWRNPVPIHTHPRLAEVVDDDVVAVVAVAVAGVVEGARHELVAGVPRRRHVEARAVGDINCWRVPVQEMLQCMYVQRGAKKFMHV